MPLIILELMFECHQGRDRIYAESERDFRAPGSPLTAPARLLE